MASVTNIKQVGAQLHLINDDNSVIIAYPTPGRYWTLPQGESGGGGPDPSGPRFQWPVALSSVSSEYGPRTGGYSSVHQGIDLAPGAGTPIAAAGAGKVHIEGVHKNFGNWCVLVHPAVGNSGPLYTVYAHMVNRATVRTGQAVARGKIIGNVGNSGASFGAHLHFETHVGSLGWNNPGPHINPRLFMTRYANA